MQGQPMLTEQEWGLVLQLLKAEREELPTEIHHTDSRQFASELEEREKLIDSVVTRLQVCGINA